MSETSDAASGDTAVGGAAETAAAETAPADAPASMDASGPDRPLAAFDRIADFGFGDRIDFSKLFEGAPPISPNDVVHVIDTAAGTIVAAALGPEGQFVDVILLEGVHGIDADDLIANGALIV